MSTGDASTQIFKHLLWLPVAWRRVMNTSWHSLCQVVTREDLGWGSAGDVLGRQQSIRVSDAYSCGPLPRGRSKNTHTLFLQCQMRLIKDAGWRFIYIGQRFGDAAGWVILLLGSAGSYWSRLAPGTVTLSGGQTGVVLVVRVTKVKEPFPGSHSVNDSTHTRGRWRRRQEACRFGRAGHLGHWQAQKKEGERMSAVI